MREILFRGKRSDTGEWIYGDLRQDADLESAYIGGWDYFTADYALQREPFEYPVSPETVSQFTGLYDENGVRIFENDIVRYTDLAFNPNIGRFENMIFTSAVTYNLDNGCFSPFEPDTFESYIRAENVEVIGNRFDNPDLLN